MPLLDNLCGSHGVGPVCHELNIAPSTYYRHQNYRQHPETRSQRDLRDEHLKLEIQRVYDENYRVYGIRKVWRQLQRDGFSVARCTIAYRHQWKPRSCWMHWSKLCGPDGHPAPSITQIKAHSTYRWRTHSDCRKRSFWLQRAAPVTLTIMPWPKASTVCTKRR